MMFAFILSAAVCASVGMRPEARHYKAASFSRLTDLVASAARSEGSKSLEPLVTAASIVNSIILQAGNITEHMSDDDKALLNSVINLIDKSIYGSMDSSHQADVAAIQAAIDTASQCNSDIAARLGEGGDLNKLYLGAAGYQNTLNDLQDDVDATTEVNNSRFDDLQRHINIIGSSPDCVDFPINPNKLKADNFFAGSDYVNWYTAQQEAYDPIAKAFEAADQNLEDALSAYAVGLAERNVAYCDWKVEFEGGCATFDQCYQDKVNYYNNELKPALDKDMQVRIDAYKAGEAIIAQIGFLLGDSTESAPPTDIDTSRFQLTFSPVPAKGECSLSPLDADEWVPTPQCEVTTTIETTIEWIMGAEGADCDQTCTARDADCAGDQEWKGWPESADEIMEVARKAGLECTTTADRCDLGEAPLFDNGNCYFCNPSGKNAFVVDHMPRCRNKFGDRTRMCPCKSTSTV